MAHCPWAPSVSAQTPRVSRAWSYDAQAAWERQPQRHSAGRASRAAGHIEWGWWSCVRDAARRSYPGQEDRRRKGAPTFHARDRLLLALAASRWMVGPLVALARASPGKRGGLRLRATVAGVAPLAYRVCKETVGVVWQKQAALAAWVVQAGQVRLATPRCAGNDNP